jgi:16S rRNA (cytosine1402-N4)-methyltransferase
MTVYHVPVLLEAALDLLITDPGGTYVDATIGGGGHAEAVLDRLSGGGRLLGIDRDAEALDACRARFGETDRRLLLARGPFAEMERLAGEAGVNSAQGVLFDLGVSSHQIDDPARGFSYLSEGPLGMRMDGSSGPDARDVVNGYSEARLADLFRGYGEERRSRLLASAVVRARAESPIETTRQFADVIRRNTPDRWHSKTLSRVFQALRIEVNDELGQLAGGLEAAERLLTVGGRIAVIAYHSLEDRLVKRFFRPQTEASRDAAALRIPDPPSRFRVLTKKVVVPSPEEIRSNPRARSAKLRAAEKTGAGAAG